MICAGKTWKRVLILGHPGHFPCSIFYHIYPRSSISKDISSIHVSRCFRALPRSLPRSQALSPDECRTCYMMEREQDDVPWGHEAARVFEAGTSFSMSSSSKTKVVWQIEGVLFYCQAC